MLDRAATALMTDAIQRIEIGFRQKSSRKADRVNNEVVLHICEDLI